jgi:hypothetical protein
MVSRLLLTLKVLVALALLLTSTATCPAQAPPADLPTSIVASSSAITPEQVTQIKTFAEYWCGQMAGPSAAPESIEAAGARLVKPLASLNQPSATFKFEYSKILVPLLEPVIDNSSSHAAINAVNVAAQLGTNRALNLLIAKAVDKNVKWQVRQRAAAGCEVLMRSPGLTPKEVVDASRRLRDASKDEDHNDILLYEFRALSAAADHPSLDGPGKEATRDNQIDAIATAITNRLGNAQNSDTVYAIHAAIDSLFKKFIGGSLTGDDLSRIGRQLGPALAKGVDSVRQQWQPAHADPQATRTYGNFVKGCEDFLKRIDPEVRKGASPTPPTSLKDSFDGQKKDQFDADSKRWMDIVSQAPYGKK